MIPYFAIERNKIEIIYIFATFEHKIETEYY